MTTIQRCGDGEESGRTLDALSIPPHVGDRLADFYGLGGRISTGAEWADSVRAAAEDRLDRRPTAEDLCRDPDGRHAVDVDGEEQSFVCVLDPLIVPFLRGRPATVRSVTPTDGATVRIEVSEDGATATPADAVLSLGIDRDAGADGGPALEAVYRQVCEHVHAFASPAEYERWAEDVDAATTSVPIGDGVAIARALSDALFESGDDEEDCCGGTRTENCCGP